MEYHGHVQLRDAINDFLTHCEVGKYQSRKTVENYHHYLKRFERFAKPKTDVVTANPAPGPTYAAAGIVQISRLMRVKRMMRHTKLSF